MNAKQSSRLNATVSTLALLKSEKYQPLWSAKPSFSAAVSALEAVVDRITACVEKQIAKDGAAAEKATSLSALGDAAFEIAVATKAFAAATGNKFLAGQMDFSRSEITKGRNSSVLARSQTILDAAGEHVDELADYEVTSAKLKALEKKIASFREVQSKPRHATASGAAATKELPKLFRQASEILTERLDGLMVLFKTNEPTFYGEYRAARLVVNSRTGAAEAKVVPVSNTTPVAKAA